MPISEPDLSGDSPELVALSLMFLICDTEKMTDRQSILDLYAECLKAATGKRPLPSEARSDVTIGM